VAKNAGLHKNPADLVVLLDDDAYPLPGAVARMIDHFEADPTLGAAVFDVMLPDGSREGSAYPDVFIGAGTGLRNSALRQLAAEKQSGGRGGPLLPRDFFMQAEEYDLSFRLIAAGYSVQRFADLPLMHLKSPGARIGQRTTRLDVRNNLYLLAKYLPARLCHELAADWLSRYWRMALARDQRQSPDAAHGTHKQAFIRGAAQGLAAWGAQRQGGRLVLAPGAIEHIFKFEAIEHRLARLATDGGLRRIAFADMGKNLLAYFQAAKRLGLEVTAIVDDQIPGGEYRGIEVIPGQTFLEKGSRADALVITTLSRVHAQRRGEALRRSMAKMPVIDLFAEAERGGRSGEIDAAALVH
jgi:hypothetical protein